ncbi:hypothetical protein HAP41_0000047470 (plasmid) [Bradyrhizobium barranii subsp. apii]|uniref:Uncharacterized protein n=1 Tax=Bradyrhizobium barranii subsp. apii TaxID=2819348 RepID=A0A8T5VPC1_9BRAD|nr:hypothetical protein [Bradyrhizobium barranii]UPT92225.1 hypothetical protein HAP41_0000047470 [Bradyrhizobium barranii subsp. apii]
MIALDHFSSFATLLLQLERRLEEVDVAHHTRRLDAIEAAIAHEAADDGAYSTDGDQRLQAIVITDSRRW